MKKHLSSRVAAAALLVAMCGVASSGVSHLALTAKSAQVSVEQSAFRRQALTLPDLKFEFQIDAICDAPMRPRSLMISVADTRKRVMSDALTKALDSGLSLTIPARQVAPLAMEKDCSQPADGAMIVRGVLSAQAALACESDERSHSVYASASLDVAISCSDPNSLRGVAAGN